MIPLRLLAAFLGRGVGYFNLQPTYTFQSNENTNGADTTGELIVQTDGSFDYTGDTGGVNRLGIDEWWTPLTSVRGTWHARLNHTSGTNQYSASGSDALNTWVALSGTPEWNFLKTTSGTGGGTTVGTYTLDFSNDAGSTTYASSSVTVTLFEETL